MNEKPIDLHQDPDAAAEMAVNAVMLYLGQSGITDKIEIGRWIRKVFNGVCDRVDRAS